MSSYFRIESNNDTKNIELTTIADSIDSIDQGIMIKQTREQMADELASPYDPDKYDYKRLSSSYQQLRKMNGLSTTEENNYKVPYNEVIYLEAIRYVMFFIASYALIRSFEVYLLAAIGVAPDVFEFGSNTLDFILVPATRILFNDTYRLAADLIADPLIIATCCVVYFFLMKVVECKLTDQLAKNHHFGYMMSARLKNLMPSKGVDIAKQVEVIMGYKADMRVTLVYHSLKIEKFFQEYNKKLIDFKLLMSKGMEPPEDKVQDLQKLRDLVNRKQRVILKKHNKLKSSYALITFFNYKDNFCFITKAKDYDGVIPDNLTQVFYHYNFIEDVFFAPDAYDIDWNYYAKSETFNVKLIHKAMQVTFFCLFPAVTYFINYTVSLAIVQSITTQTDSIVMDNLTLFTGIRLLLSTVYSQLCSLVIDVYFAWRPFKTHSDRIESKFYFYNFYYMINQVAVDFYATMRAGIASLESESTADIIKNHQAFIYTSAVKVALVLIIAPLWQYLFAFYPKLKAKLYIRFAPKQSTMLDAVTAELPVEHDVGNMASVMIQCVFYVSFFSRFMIPTLNLLISAGLVLFFFVERYFVWFSYSMRKGLNISNVTMIYKMFFWAFVTGNLLSIGSTAFVISIFSHLSFTAFNSIFQNAIEYTFMLIVIIFAFYMQFMYSEFRLKYRILINLADKGGKGLVAENNEFDNKYKFRNAFYKAQKYLYTV